MYPLGILTFLDEQGRGHDPFVTRSDGTFTNVNQSFFHNVHMFCSKTLGFFVITKCVAEMSRFFTLNQCNLQIVLLQNMVDLSYLFRQIWWNHWKWLNDCVSPDESNTVFTVLMVYSGSGLEYHFRRKPWVSMLGWELAYLLHIASIICHLLLFQ